MRYLRKLRRWHFLVFVSACVAGLWFYGDAVLGIERKPDCIYDVDQGIGPVDRNVCAVSLWAELQLIERKLCKDGSCGIDPEQAPPDAEMAALRGLMSSLPVDWASARLFPVPSELSIPAGQRISLTFKRADGDSRVLTGRVALAPDSAALTMKMEMADMCRGDDGKLNGQKMICTQTITPGGPAKGRTSIAVAAQAGAILQLDCAEGGGCSVILDSGSANLPGDGKCKCEE